MCSVGLVSSQGLISCALFPPTKVISDPEVGPWGPEGWRSGWVSSEVSESHVWAVLELRCSPRGTLAEPVEASGRMQFIRALHLGAGEGCGCSSLTLAP